METELRNQSSEQQVAFFATAQLLHHTPSQEPKISVIEHQFHAHCLEQPVVAFGSSALEEATCLAVAPNAVADLGATGVGTPLVFYRCHVILKICVDADHHVARSREQSCEDCTLLTEVPGQL